MALYTSNITRFHDSANLIVIEWMYYVIPYLSVSCSAKTFLVVISAAHCAGSRREPFSVVSDDFDVDEAAQVELLRPEHRHVGW